MAKNTDPSKFSGEPLANAGRSIIEMLWELMDETYAELMDGAGKRMQGRASGLADALALMTNPYLRDADAIKAAAHARWEDAQEEDEEQADD